MHKRVVVSRSSVEYFFVLQCRKNSQGNTSLFHRISGIKKIYREEGGGGGGEGTRISRRKVFVSQCRKIS